MLVRFLQKHRFLRDCIFRLGENRGKEFADWITPFLSKKNKILDIGTGTGHVCQELNNRGYKAHPLDVENLSFTPNVNPQIFDGKRIPYLRNAFDVSLLLTVLHHTDKPEEVLRESVRVARRIIIIEDIYTSSLHKYTTFFFDSLLNLEFAGHPHSNKSDSEWRAIFKAHKLRLVEARYFRSYGIFKQVVYVLEP